MPIEKQYDMDMHTTNSFDDHLITNILALVRTDPWHLSDLQTPLPMQFLDESQNASSSNTQARSAMIGNTYRNLNQIRWLKDLYNYEKATVMFLK